MQEWSSDPEENLDAGEASKGPALPFVADDLFIHFDDERAAAGLMVPDRLSCKTQVLFFTHHRHLVDLALDVLGPSLNLVDLSDAPPLESAAALEAA